MIACNLTMESRAQLGPWMPFREVEFRDGRWRYVLRGAPINPARED